MEHTKILKELVFYNFHKMFPDRIIGITNGVSQRRWIQCANPSLADLITRSLGDEEWLINLNLLSQLNAWKFDKGFIRQFIKVRFENKRRLIEFLCAKS
jgi:starch phosphorylase